MPLAPGQAGQDRSGRLGTALAALSLTAAGATAASGLDLATIVKIDDGVVRGYEL